MKLRNKKTGEIKDIPDQLSTLWNMVKESLPDSGVWEDYEEPKEHWYVDCDGEIVSPAEDLCNESQKDMKQIGNYFETKEEAEKAVEKLKAWHKLMDYWGTEILGWEIRDMPTGGNWQTVNVKFNVKTRKEPLELLDILFGGEE